MSRYSKSAVQEPSPSALSPRAPKVSELLRKVRGFLEDQNYPEALNLIAHSKTDSPWATNALGVVRLRQGNAAGALESLRGLALGSGGLTLRTEIPMVFKTNYATALLLSGHVDGARDVLQQIGDEGGETARKLRAAFAKWQEGLSVWQKLNWCLGGTPSRPVELDFTPGDLE